MSKELDIRKNLFNIDLKPEALALPLYRLEELYAKLPETKGCTSCGKCCKVQCPNMYYIEFLHILTYMQDNFDKPTVDGIFSKSFQNAISLAQDKQCPFLDDKNKCMIYEVRHYNCRVYGIIPKGEYQDRVKQAKKRLGVENISLEKQCDKVSIDGEGSNKGLNDIFEQLKQLEEEIGVSKNMVRLIGGSYLTFHDMLILHFFHDNDGIIECINQLKVIADDDPKKIEFTKLFEEQLLSSDRSLIY